MGAPREEALQCQSQRVIPDNQARVGSSTRSKIESLDGSNKKKVSGQRLLPHRLVPELAGARTRLESDRHGVHGCVYHWPDFHRDFGLALVRITGYRGQDDELLVRNVLQVSEGQLRDPDDVL